METFLKDKKINIVIFVLLSVISLFFIVKFINEIKLNKYIGHESQSPNVIYVTGKGEVKAIPDIASLHITISKEAKTAQEAQDILNKSVSKTLDYLKKTIAKKDIKSEYGGFNPKYSYSQPVCITYPCPPRNSKIIGYTATQTITVKIRKVDDANKIRTKLTELGVTNITGPTFSIDNSDVYKEEARLIAINKAKNKAKVLAKDLGIKLGRITNFSENNSNNYPRVFNQNIKLERAGASSSSAPELPKGENTITSNVTITYEIR